MAAAGKPKLALNLSLAMKKISDLDKYVISVDYSLAPKKFGGYLPYYNKYIKYKNKYLLLKQSLFEI